MDEYKPPKKCLCITLVPSSKTSIHVWWGFVGKNWALFGVYKTQPFSWGKIKFNKGDSCFDIFLHNNYRLSVRSLFILLMRAETLRSMVRSPTSTTSPPIISGLTCKIDVWVHVSIQKERRQCSLHNRRVSTYSVGNLELLALADVGGLGNGSLQTRQSLGVKSLRRFVLETKFDLLECGIPTLSCRCHIVV